MYGCGGGSPSYSYGSGTGSGGAWSVDYGIAGASLIGAGGYSYYGYGGYGYAGSSYYPYTPPPPPPPQDCYAGPAPTCTPPPAPHALRTTPYITSPAHDITSAAGLLRGPRKITETVPPNTNPVNGIKPSPTTNGNPATGSGSDPVDLLTPIRDLQPALPTAPVPTGFRYEQPQLPFGDSAGPSNVQLELPLDIPHTSTSGGNVGQGGGGGGRIAATPCEPTGSGVPSVPPFEDLSNMRASDRIPQIDEPRGGKYARARLDVGGEMCYGRNGSEFPYQTPPNVADSAMTHAEGQAFAKAAASGISGGEADLYVDQEPCPFCTNSFRGLARSLNLEYLRVWTPQGMYGYYDIATDEWTLGSP